MDTRSHLTRNTLLALSIVLALGACNTMKGVGKDTEVVGEKIQKEADQHIEDDGQTPPTP